MNDLYVMGALCSPNKLNNVIKRFFGKLRMTMARFKMTLGKLRVTSGKSLVSYVLYLATIMILFCVCLAHARQQGLGTPVATGVAFQNSYPLNGKVLSSETNEPLEGATISVWKSNIKVLTDVDGAFRILVPDTGGILLVRYIGYKIAEIPFSKENKGPLTIQLKNSGTQLEEVQVSTGYQTLPKERATGSFVQIDTELLNRRVSTNILDRLDGVTSGLIFNTNNNRQFGQSDIQIRGRSTLFANSDPLIILDNFPYEGDISNINPNDIENITILKDAAAASAWGARAGNGVIVITTKKGRLGNKPKVEINTNVTIGEKPDLYYTPQLSASEYIEVEQYLFNKGLYNVAINNGFTPLSPAVEIFAKARSGTISQQDSLSSIRQLASYDNRSEMLRYYYRPSVNQQYQASLSGGEDNHSYFFSAGYDKNLESNVTNKNDRITLNATNTYYLLDRKLEFFSNILFTSSNSESLPRFTPSTPYDRLADEAGNPLPIARDLRLPYADTAGNGQLLDWRYFPLRELQQGYSRSTTNHTDYRLNTSLSYTFLPGLKASVNYSFQKGMTDNVSLNELESYYTRNRINTFTQIDAAGQLSYPIPMGAIRNVGNSTSSVHYGRAQLDLTKTWAAHAVNALAGFEIRSSTRFSNSIGLYGYNEETATDQNAAINFKELFPYYYGFNTARIPTHTQQNGADLRYLSYYLNASYTYLNRYILSVSARKDESNLFGVSSNQKGVPLWSTGLSWLLNQESFYQVAWMPKLQLRATFGYTGNVDNSLSALLTANRGSGQQRYNTYFTEIVNPPNPSLRWEKIRNVNFGVDFGLFSNHLNGSIDYWLKDGLDLIGNSPIAPQTGITLFKGNSANTSGRGIDVVLNTVNTKGALNWSTNFLYNYTKDKVRDYKVSNGSNFNVVSANYNNPLEGYPYYALFAFPYGGLDEQGDPIGVLAGSETKEYAAIMNNQDRSNLVFVGSAIPTHFGSVRNNFRYMGFDLSFNITYKMSYFFRRPSLNNGSLHASTGSTSAYQQADYHRRWQQPGDEEWTDVPALVYPANLTRTNLYLYSDALVEKGDHIRLQDIRFGYSLSSKQQKLFRSINFFMYLNNIGILYRSNRQHIDPDYPTGVPQARTISFGLKAII
jgi:TonB-dependent starch-binding outer membrane protein SusC